MKALTKQQAAALKAVRRLQAQGGAASLGDVKQAIGGRSRYAVGETLGALISRGLVARVSDVGPSYRALAAEDVA